MKREGVTRVRREIVKGPALDRRSFELLVSGVVAAQEIISNVAMQLEVVGLALGYVRPQGEASGEAQTGEPKRPVPEEQAKHVFGARRRRSQDDEAKGEADRTEG